MPESHENNGKQTRHASAAHDGREIDILEVFFWPFLVGGPYDGQPVEEKRFKSKELPVDGGEGTGMPVTYVRHRYHGAGFPGRIYYFADPAIPSGHFEPYIVARRILNTHQDIIRLPDITWDKSKPRPKDIE